MKRGLYPREDFATRISIFILRASIVGLALVVVGAFVNLRWLFGALP